MFVGWGSVNVIGGQDVFVCVYKVALVGLGSGDYWRGTLTAFLFLYDVLWLESAALLFGGAPSLLDMRF